MKVAATIIQVVLAAAFLAAGGSKLAGAQAMVANFELWGYPQWFRLVTGSVEAISALGLLIGIWRPALAGLAGLWLAIAMLGAIYTEVFRGPIGPLAALPPLVLFLLAAGIARYRLRQLSLD